jgi:serine/threonine-protein kinase
VTGRENAFSPSLSPDGRTLIYDFQSADSRNNDLWILPLEGERRPRPFLATPAEESGARFSPNGRYIAYVSRASGRSEVFVRPFPEGAGVWQVSRGGSGIEPKWSQDGRELYYRDRGLLYRVAVDTRGTFSAAFSAGAPERVAAGLRTGDNMRSYSPAPDGTRFVALPGWEVSLEATQVNLAFAWGRYARRRLGLEP